MRRLWAMAWVGLVACSARGGGGVGGVDGGGGSGGNVTKHAANACATRGATYLRECGEFSGNCGSIPDQVVNVMSDGTVSELGTCEASEQDGCTVRRTNCKTTTGLCTTSVTYQTTFVPDGSSAESVVTINSYCTNGEACLSTYDCTLTRQSTEISTGGGSGQGGNGGSGGFAGAGAIGGSSGSGGSTTAGGCDACMQTACGYQLDACLNDSACAQLVDCVNACAGGEGCLSSCETALPDAKALFHAFLNCVFAACYVECK